MEKPRIFIGSPSHTGLYAYNYHTSMLFTVAWAIERGIKLTIPPHCGDSHVDRARGQVRDMFDRSDCTHLLWIDTDIGWHPSAIQRLLDADKDVVCACYPCKQDELLWPINFSLSQTIEIENGFAPLLQLKDGPTGFMLIKRSVFDRMKEAYPERRVIWGPNASGWLFFDSFVDKDGRFLSEDYGFCRLWQDIGGEIWLDPNIELTHFGAKTFSFGSPLDQWRRDAERRQLGPWAPWHKAYDIAGWMQLEELRWLGNTAAQMDSAIEVGCWKGRSTYAIASMCRGQVMAVDTWAGSDEPEHEEARKRDIFADFTKNLSGLDVIPVRKKSLEAAIDAPEADFVFIDASHTYEDVLADIAAWLPKAKKVLAGHDYTDENHPGVRKAVDEVFGEHVQRAAESIWYVDIPAFMRAQAWPERKETECARVA